jgi:DNA-directed RNA polymerase specialized sigma24 family protein
MKLAPSYDAARGKSLGGWLLFLADREAINILRREARTAPRSGGGELEELAAERPPEGDLLSAEFAETVVSALGQLSDLEREVISADIEEGKSVSAAVLAGRLKTAASSVYSARARARRKLARLLPVSQRQGFPA